MTLGTVERANRRTLLNRMGESREWEPDVLTGAQREEMASEVAQRVNAELGPATLQQPVEQIADTVQEVIQRQLEQALKRREVQISLQEEDSLALELFHRMVGLGFLEELLPPARTDLTEIIVNPDGRLWVMEKGRTHFTLLEEQSFTRAQLMDVVDKILAPLGRRVTEAEPIASCRLPRSARLPAGARVHVVIPPIAVGTKGAQAAEYPALNIRLFEEEPVVPEQLVGWGALNEEMLEFLSQVVRKRKSMVIAGGTGTGKTTMLAALLTFIPPEDRVVTIEDTAELRLTASHWVSLESRPPSVEGKYEISMADLINASLRMTPTWVIVGEIRTGMACAQLLQTQISGHSGMSTIHADTPRKAVQTLVLRGLQSGQLPKVAAIKTLIALAVDCFVQIQYDRRGMRRVTHISEVDEELQGGEVQLRDIFRFTEDSGEPTWERVEEPQRLAT